MTVQWYQILAGTEGIYTLRPTVVHHLFCALVWCRRIDYGTAAISGERTEVTSDNLPSRIVIK
jgi:hypothetical protein